MTLDTPRHRKTMTDKMSNQNTEKKIVSEPAIAAAPQFMREMTYMSLGTQCTARTASSIQSPSLIFNEAEHKYTLRRAGLADIVLPSVTQVMEPLERKVYGDISQTVLDNAADRGTRVHRAAEQYLKYRFHNVDADCVGYFNGFVKFLSDHPDWKPIHSEYRFYHKALFYAGTADLLEKTTNGIVLVDFKTTSQVHTALWGVQLAAYWQGIQNYSGSIDIQQARVVQLSGDGRYVLHEIKPNMPLFLSCLQIYNFND